jgi:superfamily II DNA or RNA helicase
MSYALREHQTVAIERILTSLNTGHRTPLLQASTGFGKTLIAIDLIKRFLEQGKRVMFVVDRVTLIDQTSSEFDKHGLDHGVIQGDHWRVNNSALQLASAQSITRRRHKPDVDIIIVDEAHSLYKAFVKLMMETWSALPFIGLSATPFTKGLGNIYDDLIAVETTSSLIAKGYLCDYLAYGAPINLKGLKTVAGDFNQKELAKRVNTKHIVGDVVNTWLRLGDNRQTICFAVSVAHSEAIVDEFKANGVTAAHMDAYTDPDERHDILAAHNNGDIQVLSNVGITTKGWDSPNTSCLILARPTKSLMLYIQMVGRVLRVSECGSDAIILDHGANIERLGFPTDRLPEYLCHDDLESKQRKKKEDEEKAEKLPTPCAKCRHLSAEFVCPACGHRPEIIPMVSAVDGDLKVMERVLQSDKDRWYSMLLGYARKHKYKDGWAAHKYKTKFDVWPARKTGVHAVEPNTEVMNFIKYQNIRFQKSSDSSEYQKPEVVHSSPVDGFIYTPIRGSDDRAMVRVTDGEGKYVCFAPHTPEILRHVGFGGEV